MRPSNSESVEELPNQIPAFAPYRMPATHTRCIKSGGSHHDPKVGAKTIERRAMTGEDTLAFLLEAHNYIRAWVACNVDSYKISTFASVM